MEENKKRDETNVEPTRKSRKFLVSPNDDDTATYKDFNKRFEAFQQIVCKLNKNAIIFNKFVLLIQKRKQQGKSELFLNCYEKTTKGLRFLHYISGLFPDSNSTYKFDYNGYFYSLKLLENKAVIERLGKKRENTKFT